MNELIVLMKYVCGGDGYTLAEVERDLEASVSELNRIAYVLENGADPMKAAHALREQADLLMASIPSMYELSGGFPAYGSDNGEVLQ